MAVIVCGLAVTFRLLVVSWATPLVPTATAPRKEPLSSKTTWPVAVPDPGLLTLRVAVKVKFWPNTAEEPEGVGVMVVVAGVTICSQGAEVLAAQQSSPP